MKINRGREAGLPSEERTATFTGSSWGDALLRDVPGVMVNTVFFPPGARTHWHTHERGQVLLVTHGRGFAVNEAGEGGPIQAGDVVWFAPDERHWHGGGPDTYLSHIAVSLGETRWEDAVSDEQYGAAPS
jgi:quercetin dioxygenase-like cupin family protein